MSTKFGGLTKARTIEGMSEDQLQMLARTGQRYLNKSSMPKFIKSILKILGYVVIGGSFVYMYFPLDLIPDAIPVAGMADDSAFTTAALAVAGVLAKVKQLERFKGLAQMAMSNLEKKDAQYQAVATETKVIQPRQPAATPPSATIRVRLPRN